MFRKVLIANRGEIACRVIHTCQRMGIQTVAVYSDADHDSLHVRLANESVHIGASLAAESYLNMDCVLAAARQTGAEAIHPGFGFLSENSEFVERCEKENVTFIGPSARTIEVMGSKCESKALMEKAGVPVVPGYHGDKQNAKHLAAAAEKIGYPLMIKASAGGGGKGMRSVKSGKDFSDSLLSAKREAKNAFGDDKVLLEKFVNSPRHIEFQIFGDTHGNTVHLFERECSIQRRYQKILEETPSQFLDDKLRMAMGNTAVEAARAVNYVNAGTVEFIVDVNQNFYFMEMNTRLQVEHPVTETVTGQDLVEWQLRVASGEELPLAQDKIKRNGHAIEVRLYAEDPERDFLPATGQITHFAFPELNEHFRVDTGVESGDEISMHYDPMIAKLIAWDINRESCISTLRESLSATAVFGLTTNLQLLRAILGHHEFHSGNYNTEFIDANREVLVSCKDEFTYEMCVAAAARDWLDRASLRREKQRYYESPWHRGDGWQANDNGGVRYCFRDSSGNTQELFLLDDRARFRIRSDISISIGSAELHGDDFINFEINDSFHSMRVRRAGDQFLVQSGMQSVVLQRTWPFSHDGSHGIDETHPGSPMPGRIVAVHVKEGDSVEPGQPLLVLEGMKMEYTLKATVSGVIDRLLHREGDMVDAEVPLVDIATAE